MHAKGGNVRLRGRPAARGSARAAHAHAHAHGRQRRPLRSISRGGGGRISRRPGFVRTESCVGCFHCRARYVLRPCARTGENMDPLTPMFPCTDRALGALHIKKKNVEFTCGISFCGNWGCLIYLTRLKCH